MKKILVTVLAVIMAMGMIFGMTACNNSGDNDTESKGTQALPALSGMENPDYSTLEIPSNFKIGLICLHDTNSTYDKNFIDAFKAAAKDLGIPESNVIVRTNIDEDTPCYEAARDLATTQGCSVIFADSFGHEDYIIQAAREYPNVQFCHATGTQAHTVDLPNFHNAFANIYEGRYLAGVAAGLKIKEMIDNGESVNGNKVTATSKIGYVGAWPYAEVKSGYTSFFLGVRSIVPGITMEVSFTNSWYDEAAEKETANKMINDGCILISQHADSMGAPSACEAKGVPNISYNGSTVASCPTTFIVSSKINWAPYYKMCIAKTIKGEAIPTDYVGTLKSGSVELTEINLDVAAEGTIAKLVEVRDQIVAGTLKIFDTSKFTVTIVDTGDWTTSHNLNATVDTNGKLTAYQADVDSDPYYAADHQVITNGIFEESTLRSAPYFDVDIDGIIFK